MTAVPGRRDELLEILLEGTSSMPGCLSYVVATDAADPDALWITEVWDNEANHRASLTLPQVRAAIDRGRPLIAGFSNQVTTAPVGGQGISAASGDYDAELRRLHREVLDAWNRRDAAAFADLFASEGSIVGFDGTPVDGPERIEAHLTGIFTDHAPARYVAIVREVRETGPVSALLRAVAGMVPPGAREVKADVNAIQSLVAQRGRDGRWRIELFQNTPAAFHGRPQAAAALTAELQRQADTERVW